MFDWTLFIYAVLLTLAVGGSYIFVLTNATGDFPLETQATNYINSPYWLNMPRDSIIGVVVLQAFALAGYIAWVIWICTTTEYGTSFLAAQTHVLSRCAPG